MGQEKGVMLKEHGAVGELEVHKSHHHGHHPLFMFALLFPPFLFQFGFYQPPFCVILLCDLYEFGQDG